MKYNNKYWTINQLKKIKTNALILNAFEVTLNMLKFNITIEIKTDLCIFVNRLSIKKFKLRKYD